MSTFGPPQESWAGGVEPARKGISGGVVTIIGAALFCMGCLSGYIVGTGQNLAGFLTQAWEDPQAVVTVDAPERVAPGETFDVVVRVKDISQRRRVVMDIDFEGAICAAFAVVSMYPSAQGQYEDVQYREATFEQALAPGAEASFRWTLRASGAGYQSGVITAYLDEDYLPVPVPVTIEIGE